MICSWCNEPIKDKEERIYYSGDIVYHYECNLRGIIGSVAHIEKRCSCYVPGSEENDPEGMTRREAAKAAMGAWINRGKTL